MLTLKDVMNDYDYDSIRTLQDVLDYARHVKDTSNILLSEMDALGRISDILVNRIKHGMNNLDDIMSTNDLNSLILHPLMHKDGDETNDELPVIDVNDFPMMLRILHNNSLELNYKSLPIMVHLARKNGGKLYTDDELGTSLIFLLEPSGNDYGLVDNVYNVIKALQSCEKMDDDVKYSMQSAMIDMKSPEDIAMMNTAVLSFIHHAYAREDADTASIAGRALHAMDEELVTGDWLHDRISKRLFLDLIEMADDEGKAGFMYAYAVIGSDDWHDYMEVCVIDNDDCISMRDLHDFLSGVKSGYPLEYIHESLMMKYQPVRNVGNVDIDGG